MANENDPVKQEASEHITILDHVLCRERRDQDRARFLARNWVFEKEVSDQRSRLTAMEMDVERKQDRIDELETQVRALQNPTTNSENECRMEREVLDVRQKLEVARNNFSKFYNPLVSYSTAISRTLSDALKLHTESITGTASIAPAYSRTTQVLEGSPTTQPHPMKATPTAPTPAVPRNRHGQRVDMPLRVPPKDKMNRIKNLKLCNQFVLRG